MKKIISILVVLVTIVSCQNKSSNKEIEKNIEMLFSKQENFTEIANKKDVFSEKISSKFKDLMQLIKEDEERLKNSTTPTDKPTSVDGSVLTSLIDGFHKYKIKNIEVKDKIAVATVEFEYESTPKTIWTDKIIFIEENGWKIDNIEFDVKLSYIKDLIKRLELLSEIAGSYTKIYKDSKGNELEVVYGKKDEIETATVTFQGETSPELFITKSANGNRYADKEEKYVFWTKNTLIMYNKNEKSLFYIEHDFLPYQEAENYFVKNDYKDQELHYVKIKSEEELNKILGIAAHMGKDGKPTKIDFSKSYVIALIGKTNNTNSDIDINVIEQLEDKSIVIYLNKESNKNNKKQSHTSRPLKVIIMDNGFQGNIKITYDDSNLKF